MYIEKTKYSDVEKLMGWFPDRESGYLWGGPALRFPFIQESFLKDIRWHEIPSYSLIDSESHFIGFGQYYEKLGRCHLARLAISPQLRGAGRGQWFIARLVEIGLRELGLQEASLFVASNNSAAFNCYMSLGFRREHYPFGHQNYEGIDYMVLKNP